MNIIIVDGEFEDILVQALEPGDKSLLRKSLSIYKDHYLEEEGWLWTEPRKQELRKKFASGLRALNSNI